MIYVVNNNEIDIPILKKPFGKGSEGQVYKIGDTLYKIYYPGALKESYGNKESHHKYLMPIQTKQIILPTHPIYTQDGNYVGYTTPVISGNQKKKTGITQIPSTEFIKNLQVLENDFDILTQNYVLAADVSTVNYIFNSENNTMNIIDPGRYRHHTLERKENYQIQNDAQLRNLIFLLLYLDFIEYKPVGSKRKEQELKDLINRKLKLSNQKLSSFFKDELKPFETVDEYAKSLKKYIK